MHKKRPNVENNPLISKDLPNGGKMMTTKRGIKMEHDEVYCRKAIAEILEARTAYGNILKKYGTLEAVQKGLRFFSSGMVFDVFDLLNNDEASINEEIIFGGTADEMTMIKEHIIASFEKQMQRAEEFHDSL